MTLLPYEIWSQTLLNQVLSSRLTFVLPGVTLEVFHQAPAAPHCHPLAESQLRNAAPESQVEGLSP